MRDGKITAATKEQWEKDFSNEFQATLEKLAKSGRVMHTESAVGRRNQQMLGVAERNQKVQEFVNELLAKGMPYMEAHVRVQREHPELYPGK